VCTRCKEKKSKCTRESGLGLRFRQQARRALVSANNISQFALLISSQPTVFFSQNKLASNQPVVLFPQNKPAPVISHQPNEQAKVMVTMHFSHLRKFGYFLAQNCILMSRLLFGLIFKFAMINWMPLYHPQC
jgi:hypothetical protein